MQRVLSSVRGRIVLAAVVATSLAILLVGALVLAGARRDERAALDRRIERRADLLARPATLTLLQATDGPLRSGLAATFLAVNDLGVRIVQDGRVTRTIGDAPPSSIRHVDPGQVTTIDAGGARWRIVSAPVARRPGTRIEVAGPLAPVQDTVHRLRRRILVIGLAGLLLAAALAALVSGRAVAALARLRDAAGAVADTTHLDRRVPAGGPTEVGELADAINALLARLERSTAERERAYDATRRFAADAGHELRTPLAVLGATLETLDRNPGLSAADRAEIVGDALAEQQHLARLVEALQTLTRGDAGALGDERAVDLADTARAAVLAAERAGGLDLHADLPASTPPIHASPAGLRLLLDNLLRNAALHARAGRDVARVDVTLTPAAPDRSADARGLLELTVDDDGPGIRSADRAAATQRFVRGPGATGDGSGLGLALADQQARLAGGTLTLGDAPRGGLRVRLRFPLAAAGERPASAPDEGDG